MTASIPEEGKLSARITDSGPIPPYSIRKCRGHWHVCISGGEDDLITRPVNLTYEQALDICQRLNADPNADLSAPPAIPKTGDKTVYGTTQSEQAAIDRPASSQSPTGDATLEKLMDDLEEQVWGRAHGKSSAAKIAGARQAIHEYVSERTLTEEDGRAILHSLRFGTKLPNATLDRVRSISATSSRASRGASPEIPAELEKALDALEADAKMQFCNTKAARAALLALYDRQREEIVRLRDANAGLVGANRDRIAEFTAVSAALERQREEIERLEVDSKHLTEAWATCERLESSLERLKASQLTPEEAGILLATPLKKYTRRQGEMLYAEAREKLRHLGQQGDTENE